MTKTESAVLIGFFGFLLASLIMMYYDDRAKERHQEEMARIMYKES